MGSIGFPELLVIGLLVWVVLALARRSSGGSASIPTLVLREFSLTPDKTQVLVVRGRVAGLLGWALTSLHLSDESTFLVTRDAVSSRSGSLHGHSQVFVPLVDVAMTACRFSAPLWMLFAAAGVAVLGVLITVAGRGDASVLLGFLLVGAIFVGLYHFNKRLEIKIDSHGGGGVGVAFKPSAIEQVSVDFNRALAAVAAINAIVLTTQAPQKTLASNAADSKSDEAPPAGPPQPSQPPPSQPPPRRGTCPSCGTVAESVDSAFCSSCGTKLPT